MRLDRLVDQIMNQLYEEEAVTTGGMVPATTTPDGTIAYLPGSFSNMRSMLQSLSILKKKWNITILENEQGFYEIAFENQMKVQVPKKAFEEFNVRVVKVVGVKQIDLTGMINEAKMTEVHSLYDQISQVLTTKLEKADAVKQILTISNFWKQEFPKSTWITLPDCLLGLGTFEKDIKTLIDRIKNIYTDDVGNLEMLVNALEENRPLNAFEPFAEYQYLVGGRLQVTYNGVVFVLELTVNNAMIQAQSLYVEHRDLVKELTFLRTVKPVKNMVYPVGQSFSPTFFTALKKMTDEIGEDK